MGTRTRMLSVVHRFDPGLHSGRAKSGRYPLDLENHWGLPTKTEALLHIYRSVNSPWLGINLDVGNFPGDPYPEIEKIAPFANIVHFKTYFGGGVWYTLDLDYPRIAGILRNANFTGYISLEMEGNEPASNAVPRSLQVMRDSFNEEI